MFKVIYGQDDVLIPWAAKRIGIASFKPDATAIGQERNGEIVAVVVFDGFSDVDCNIHIASDGSGRWLTRELLARAFAYPFIQLGYPRVTGLVPAGNNDALRFDEHLGFKREGYHRKAAPDGGDIISLGLLREDCRYIPKEYRIGSGNEKQEARHA